MPYDPRARNDSPIRSAENHRPEKIDSLWPDEARRRPLPTQLPNLGTRARLDQSRSPAMVRTPPPGEKNTYTDRADDRPPNQNGPRPAPLRLWSPATLHSAGAAQRAPKRSPLEE